MPSNVLSTIAARAKAHHESLNTAYQATYAPGFSSTPRTSTSSSRKQSTTSATSDASTSSQDRNITKAWKALKKHHREMNEAYSVYYAPGTTTPGSSRASSAAPTPKASFEAEREQLEQGKPRNYEKVWNAVKSRAIEHHRSVQNASAATYGA